MHEIRVGDCLKTLRTVPDNHFHSCITSPPYFQLRDYCHAGQIGREDAPGLYVESLVTIFRELRRTLRPDGSLWLNIGDTYAKGSLPGGVKKKDILGIPWMLAFALRADGWHLRSEIIWHKPNGTPESVKDRPSRCHEHVFLLTKTARYYYDRTAILEPNTDKKPKCKGLAIINRRGAGRWADNPEAHGGFLTYNPRGRNKRSVWSVSSSSFRASRVGVNDVDHFAVFPPALVRPCVLAGTSAAGCCSVCGTPYRRHLGADPQDAAQDAWHAGCACSAPVRLCLQCPGPAVPRGRSVRRQLHDGRRLHSGRAQLCRL